MDLLERDGCLQQLGAALAGHADRSTAFLALLQELCGCPTIAVFEDVHWADEATLDVLGFLARRLGRCSAADPDLS